MTEKREFAWPEKYVDPFQKATAPDENWVFNACMDKRPSWHRYADGYRTGATLMFRYLAMTGEREHNDVVVYPIIFCWRHYLELALKHSVRMVRVLTSTEGTAKLNEHRLMSLWEELRPHLPDLGASRNDIKVVTRTIQYLARFDPESLAFRYPTDQEGNSTQEDVPSLINLRALHETMEGIANWLDAGISEMTERLSVEAELQAQYESEMEAEYEAEMEAEYGSDGDCDEGNDNGEG